ncbi:MAG: glucodextranase DOMON-like domain-containing protein [Candidatus Firestonebacteria bacterium]
MKSVRYLFTAISLVVVAFLIPMTFIFSNLITGGLDKVLHLKINPNFSGGDIISSFMDEIGDDYGEGGLTYPMHPDFKGKGYLDIIRYNVYKPVINAPWSEDKDFWQLSFTLANMGAFETVHNFSHPVIHVYIDLDGKKGGSTETLNPMSELVRFDEEHPWDFMVHIDGYHKFGKLVSFDKTIEEKVRVYSIPERKTIYARILLNNERIKKVLGAGFTHAPPEGAGFTYHYVFVGCYDSYSMGNFMPVKYKSGLRNGGGAKSSLTPKVYDYIPPEGMNQKEILSSYNEEKHLYAKVYPLVVGKSCIKKESLINIEEYKKLSQKEIECEQASALKELDKTKSSNKEKVAEVYFRAGRYDEAEKIFNSLLAENPENVPANAYKGSLVAMKAKSSTTIQAIKYVKEAYNYLDKAVKFAKKNDELITAFINRGSVSMNIPEMVFQKSKEGASDFLNAVTLLEQIGWKDQKLIVDCYLNVAICYENANMIESAEIYFMKVKSFPDISAKARYELAKRGYLYIQK